MHFFYLALGNILHLPKPNNGISLIYSYTHRFPLGVFKHPQIGYDCMVPGAFFPNLQCGGGVSGSRSSRRSHSPDCCIPLFPLVFPTYILDFCDCPGSSSFSMVLYRTKNACCSVHLDYSFPSNPWHEAGLLLSRPLNMGLPIIPASRGIH